MSANAGGCCGNGAGQAVCGEAVEPKVEKKQANADAPAIIDHKVTLLIAAGAAMAANCEMCLNKIVPDLIEAGVGEADIRRAVEIGQFVKDKPAGRMKNLADKLTGTRLAKAVEDSDECPADHMKRETAQ